MQTLTSQVQQLEKDAQALRAEAFNAKDAEVAERHKLQVNTAQWSLHELTVYSSVCFGASRGFCVANNAASVAVLM